MCLHFLACKLDEIVPQTQTALSLMPLSIIHLMKSQKRRKSRRKVLPWMLQNQAIMREAQCLLLPLLRSQNTKRRVLLILFPDIPVNPISIKLLNLKRVYVERRAVKYLIDVGTEAFQIIELYPSEKFRFFGVCLGKDPNRKLYKV